MGVLVASRAIQKRGTRSSVKRSTFPLLSRGTQSEAWKPTGEQRKARTAGAYRSLKAKLRTPPGHRSKRVKYLPMTARRTTIARGAREARRCSAMSSAEPKPIPAHLARPVSRLRGFKLGGLHSVFPVAEMQTMTHASSSPLMGEVSAKRTEWVIAQFIRMWRRHPLSHRANAR